jgi:hypothetical protein
MLKEKTLKRVRERVRERGKEEEEEKKIKKEKKKEKSIKRKQRRRVLKATKSQEEVQYKKVLLLQEILPIKVKEHRGEMIIDIVTFTQKNIFSTSKSIYHFLNSFLTSSKSIIY